MYYGKDVFVCESKSGVLVSLKRIFRLFKKFGECTVNLSNWYHGWIRYIRYKCLRYLLKADLLIKKGKKLYPPHFCRLPLGVGTLRNQSLIGFFDTLNRPINAAMLPWFPHVKCFLTKWLGVFVCSDAVIKSLVVLCTNRRKAWKNVALSNNQVHCDVMCLAPAYLSCAVVIKFRNGSTYRRFPKSTKKWKN